MSGEIGSRWVSTPDVLASLIATKGTDEEGYTSKILGKRVSSEEDMASREDRSVFIRAREVGSSVENLSESPRDHFWMVKPAQLRALGFEMPGENIAALRTGTNANVSDPFSAYKEIVEDARRDTEEAQRTLQSVDVDDQAEMGVKNTGIVAQSEPWNQGKDTSSIGVWGSAFGPLDGHWMVPYLVALAGARGMSLEDVLNPQFVNWLRSDREDKDMGKLLDKREEALRHIDAAARSIEDDANRASANLGLMDQVQSNESYRSMVQRIRRLLQNFHGLERESSGPVGSRALKWIENYLLMYSALTPFIQPQATNLSAVEFQTVGRILTSFFQEFASPNGPAFLFSDQDGWEGEASSGRGRMVREVGEKLRQFVYKANRDLADASDAQKKDTRNAQNLLLLMGTWWLLGFNPEINTALDAPGAVRAMAREIRDVYGDNLTIPVTVSVIAGRLNDVQIDKFSEFNYSRFIAFWKDGDGNTILDQALARENLALEDLYMYLMRIPLVVLVQMPLGGERAGDFSDVLRKMAQAILNSIVNPPSRGGAVRRAIPVLFSVQNKVQEARQLKNRYGELMSVRDDQFRELEMEAGVLWQSKMFADLADRETARHPADREGPERQLDIDHRAARHLAVDVAYSSYPSLSRLDAWLRAYDEMLEVAVGQLAEWNVVVDHKRRSLRESMANLRSINAQIQSLRRSTAEKSQQPSDIPDVLPLSDAAASATETALGIAAMAPTWSGLNRDSQYSSGILRTTPTARILLGNPTTRPLVAAIAASEMKQADRRGGRVYTQANTANETKMEKAEALQQLARLAPKSGGVVGTFWV